MSLWCTINEPEVCTANGYAIGMFPPGKLAALQKSGIVLGNLLKAHVEVSREKQTPTQAIRLYFFYRRKKGKQ